MFTQNEVRRLQGMGYTFSTGMINGKPSIQRILAERHMRQCDWDRSLLLFIARKVHYIRIVGEEAMFCVYDVQLVTPWPSEEIVNLPHPGMVSLTVGHELAMLFDKPFSRERSYLILDCEPDVLVNSLKVYLGRPNLRIPYSIAY